jgi:hypothetical protein
MEIWEDVQAQASPSVGSAKGARVVPRGTSGAGKRPVTVVRQTGVPYSPNITKPGSVAQFEADRYRTFRSVSQSDESTLKFLYASANWVDDDDEGWNYRPVRRKFPTPFVDDLPEDLPLPEGLTPLGSSNPNVAAMLQYLHDLQQTETILNASVMIISRGPDGALTGVGIGTLTPQGIVTHNHYGGTFGANNTIYIEGAFGDLEFQGDRVGYRIIPGTSAASATGFIPLSATQIENMGVPVGTASLSQATTQLMSERLAYAYNPAGYLNQGCLSHNCLRVGFVGEPNTNVFQGNPGDLQLPFFSGRPWFDPIGDGIQDFGGRYVNDDGMYTIIDGNYSDPFSQQDRNFAYLDENDSPLSPGDSGAGYFLGNQLIGTYHSAAEYPAWVTLRGALNSVGGQGPGISFPVIRHVAPIPFE